MKTLKKQQGYALLVFVTLLATAAATVAVKALSNGNNQLARDKITAQALAQAKDALIGRAIADNNRPGSLPCPDTNNDGSSELLNGTNCPSYIGRLPWRTLGLPNLRDGNGDRLWYALSRNFRDGNSNPINSDSVASLTVRDSNGKIIYNGCSTQGVNCPDPAAPDAAFGTGAIAVIFSPGKALSRQDGGSTVQDRSSAGINTSSNYLDIATINGITSDNANFSDGTSSNGLIQEVKIYNPTTKVYDSITNDKLAVIAHDNLFPVVEKVVGKKFKAFQILNAYYTAWGAFPFAAPFADATILSKFKGVAATYSGLLPIDDQNYTPTWDAAPTISFSGGFTSLMDCILSDGIEIHSRWRCCITGGNPPACTNSNITIPDGVTVTVTGKLNKVGLGLWRPHNTNNVCEVRARDASGTTVLATSLNLFAANSVIVTNSLNSDGSANIVFQATGNTGGTTLQRIEFRDIRSYHTDIQANSDRTACTPTTTSPIIPRWLFNDPYSNTHVFANNWQRVMYYAVSPGFSPGGINDCEPLGTLPHVKPYCLKVNGNGGGTNIRSIVVMTGNALTGHSHPSDPSDDIRDYLEDENAIPYVPSYPPDFTYENKPRSNAFNDQVIIIAP